MEFEKLMNFSNNNVYMLFAITRKKNNKDVTKKDRVFYRVPVTSFESLPYDLELIRVMAKLSEMKTYIYISANARDTISAYDWVKRKFLEYDILSLRNLMKSGQAPDFLPQLKRFDKLWYEALMQVTSKATDYFVLDIDTKGEVVLNEIRQIISKYNFKGYQAEIKLEQETNNGYHFITTPFDPSILGHMKDVDVSKDGLLYLEKIGFE